jgi:conjugal transfer pilus assembly protein TraF
MQWLVVLLLAGTASARHSFYGDSERGWYYFEQKEEEAEPPKAHPHLMQSFQDPQQALEAFQKELETRKVTLVMRPTVENAKKYIEWQKNMMDNATEVSRVWQIALMRNPSLDSRLEHPIGQQAIQIRHDQKAESTKKKLQEFSRHFTLYVFVKDGCPYCAAFEPVLDAFAKEWGFQVKAIGLDGSRSAFFPTENAPAMVQELGIKNAPTVIAIHAPLKLALPLSVGFVSTEELVRNTIMLYDNIVDFKGDAP